MHESNNAALEVETHQYAEVGLCKSKLVVSTKGQLQGNAEGLHGNHPQSAKAVSRSSARTAAHLQHGAAFQHSSSRCGFGWDQHCPTPGMCHQVQDTQKDCHVSVPLSQSQRLFYQN